VHDWEKGWFGSKPTNCVKNIAVPINEKISIRIPETETDKVILTSNENDGALQVLLANLEGAENVKLNVSPFDAALPSRKNFEMLSELADSYSRESASDSKVDLKLTQAPESANNFFRRFSNVFRDKGLAMELYEEPAARDLLTKIPSFSDEEPMNEGVKFMNAFEQAKSVILAQDNIDKQFLGYVEKMIMTWASSADSDKKELSDAFAQATKVEGIM
jgi:hypothetical protein